MAWRTKKKKKKKILNIVGPQIRKLRYSMGLTQERFTARCQLKGWDISRGTLSQIEAQIRCVNDSELLLLAQALRVSTDTLFPTIRRPRPKAT